jgi:hypothetical protein
MQLKHCTLLYKWGNKTNGLFFEHCLGEGAFYSCGRRERRFEPSFGHRKLDPRPPAATDPPALMHPPDAVAAVGTIFDHLFPGFCIQRSRQFRA